MIWPAAPGRIRRPPRRCTGSKGNNEDFDRIAQWEAGAPAPPHLRYIRNGTAVRVGPLTVAGLGGTFAPTWFETPAAALPHTPKDDKRRHFVREEVEACKRLRGVDILMTHEAAAALHPGRRPERASPARKPRHGGAMPGKPAINEVLATLQAAAAPVRASPPLQ